MTDKKLDVSHHGNDDDSQCHHPHETMRLLLERSSCRSFHDHKIPPEVMQAVLEAGIHAATGGNLQPYSIIQVENVATRKRLDELNGNQVFIAAAPVALVFCLDWRRIKRWADLECAPFTANASFRHFWISFQDTIIAAQNICTAADALGLGSVYVGTVLECFREIRTLLALPELVFPVVLVSLGYPKERPRPKKKLGVATIVHREKYHELDDAALVAAFAEKYPGWKKEITPERLATIERVCRTCHGAAYAERCLAAIQKAGHINAVQNYFGLHYRADEMPDRNDEFLNIMAEFGFTWFQRHHPRSDR